MPDHLFLIALGLGSTAISITGLRKLHALKHNPMRRVGERIAGGRVLGPASATMSPDAPL